MSQLSKYGSNWPNKWLWQMLSSCRSMHSSAQSYSCACEDTNLKVLSGPYGETKALKGNSWAPSGDYWAPSGDYWAPSGDYWVPSGDYWAPSGDYWAPLGIIEPRLGIIEPCLGIIEPRLGIIESRLGIIEPRLGIIESHWGIIEPLLGITEPAVGINKPYLGDFVISSASSEAKTSIIARTSAKAVDSLYAQICLRTSNHLDSYYLKIFFSEPSLDIRTSSFVYNYYLRKSLSKTFRAMMNVAVD